MSDGTYGLIVVVAIGMLLVAFGGWAGTRSYQHDTFDCTNKCAGAHSIQINHKCYCEVAP